MFWRRKSRDEELDREIRSHLDLEADEQQESGLSPEEARYAAKRALGNETQIKESVRAIWQWTGYEHIAHDFRYAVRLLLKTPVVTSVAVLSLALGIGANTAIFGAINALMLRNLPVRNPEQLVSIGTLNPRHLGDAQGVSLAMFRAIQKHNGVFSDVFIWSGGGIDNFEVNGVKYPGTLGIVSGDYFSALGVHALLGRVFTRKDAPLDGRPSSQVAVISYGCWQHRFAGDPHVLGKTIHVDGTPLTIVGVSPQGFTGLDIDTEPEATIPIGYKGEQMDYRVLHDFIMYGAFARLKPGVSISQARAKLQVLWPGILKSTVPRSFGGAQRAKFFALRPDVQAAAYGNSYLRKELEKPLQVLMALVGAVLLIACVNLANLLLARAGSRRHEFGVRAVLGAGRWPLMRMLLVDALLLSCTGAALGLSISDWTARYLLRIFWTGYVPLAIDASPDVHVLLFTAGLAIFTGMLFGIVPAWQMSRSDPTRALSQSARTTGGRTGRFSRTLISLQVMLSLLLLIGAALFVRSLENLQNVKLGYNRNHVLLMLLYPQGGRARIANRPTYFHELTSRLSQLPGVVSVSYERVGPESGFAVFQVPVSTNAAGPAISAVEEWAGPGFFHTMGMRLIAGRGFTWRDDDESPRVAIISENLAQALFPNENPIGRSIDVQGEPEHEILKIAGVVNNASLWKIGANPPPAIYHALLQQPGFNLCNALVRTASDPSGMERAAERVVSSLGHQYSLRTETLKQLTDQRLVNQRMIALLASGFSLLALLLAAIGLYGVMSYAVTRRTAEIGIRMALGAMRADVLRMILGEVLLLILIGIAVALPIAFACNKLISGMLFGVSATDPAVVLISCSILTAVAAFAGFLPARRASRVDPMIALRYE